MKIISSGKQKEKNVGLKPIEIEEREIRKLQDFEETRPVQMDLFEFLEKQEKRYSNTIELYDFMPKYVWGKVKRINDTFLNSLERKFECRGVKYNIVISPARLRLPSGGEREFFPGKREELVEDALRKLATRGAGLFLDEQVGVTFTLYQLEQELRDNGHSYSIVQIKDALLICARTNITVTSEDGASILVSNLFETLGLNSKEDWKGKGKKEKAFVRFNSLVTRSIKDGSFRLLNYEKAMSYKNVIARQLHKRMSHHYTQAGLSHPYHIMLSTIIRDFGIAEYDRLSDNLKYVLKALDEMKEKMVLLSYRVEKTLAAGNRNKLVDAKLILIPHFLSAEIIEGNKQQQKVLEALKTADK